MNQAVIPQDVLQLEKITAKSRSGQVGRDRSLLLIRIEIGSSLMSAVESRDSAAVEYHFRRLRPFVRRRRVVTGECFSPTEWNGAPPGFEPGFVGLKFDQQTVCEV